MNEGSYSLRLSWPAGIANDSMRVLKATVTPAVIAGNNSWWVYTVVTLMYATFDEGNRSEGDREVIQSITLLEMSIYDISTSLLSLLLSS